jgi:hypothetical protein
MLRMLIPFIAALAVMWVFGAYAIVRDLRRRVASGYAALFGMWMTPACITCTVAVFAGVILLRS